MMWIFLAVLVFGVGAVVWALVAGGDRRDARAILGERLARGELSPDEYRERLALVGGNYRSRGRQLFLPLGVALVVLGLVGAVAAGGIAMGRGEMGWMMRDMPMMDGMMGEMMDGDESGREGDEPRQGAPERVVKGFDFRFSPSTIRVPAGERVNISLDNVGASFHTLTVKGLDFELRAQPDEEISGSIRTEEAGRYKAVCTVPGHERMGMRATVIVEEP